MQELAKNGFDYVTLDSHGNRLSSVVREEDVRKFFTGFEVDKVRVETLARSYALSLTAACRSSKTPLAGMSRSRPETLPVAPPWCSMAARERSHSTQ